MVAPATSHPIAPRTGLLLTQITETSDYDTALRKLLSDYLDLKIQSLVAESQVFAGYWGLTFAEFQERMEKNTLTQDAHSFEVEQAFWQWEKVETLRQYYEELRGQWM
jgi:hypothetical protein